MKFGIRKPNLKKSIKARTTGKIKRNFKKTINPFYGKKGLGFIKNPKKALYNKVYNKTTIGIKDIFFSKKKSNKFKEILNIKKDKNNKKNLIHNNDSNNFNKGEKVMEKVKLIIVWCISIYSILAGICSYSYTISNVLFILAGLCIMPPIVKRITNKTDKYNKKIKWIIFVILTILAFGTHQPINTVKVNNINQEQKIENEAEEKAQQEAEKQAKKETEEKAQQEAEEQARKEAEEKAQQEAEEQARKEAEEKAQQEAEEQARKEAEEKAQQEAEEQARKEAEEKAQQEAEEQARKEAEEKAQQEAEEQARRQEEIIQNSETGDNLVWIPTNGGKKYHSNSGCSNMKNPIQVTKENAAGQGYTPCKRCY